MQMYILKVGCSAYAEDDDVGGRFQTNFETIETDRNVQNLSITALEAVNQFLQLGKV